MTTDAGADADADADEVFEAERSRLLGLSYRMLGTSADAEDVVQDAWLRWQRTDRSSIAVPAAWLTTVTTRLAIDRLREVERRRETYVGPWLPEPIVVDGAGDHLELAESLTLGFLVMLDRLTPTERAVVLLADVFDEPFANVAEAVDKSPAACRQIASRARRKLQGQPVDHVATQAADRTLIDRLLGAVGSGSADALLALLAPDVVLVSDSGAGRRAARRPIVGAFRVARFLAKVGSWETERIASVDYVVANGAATMVLRDADGVVFRAVQVDEVDGAVTIIRVVINPDKLGRLDHPLPVV